MGGFDSFSSVFGMVNQFANTTASLRKSYSNYKGATQAYEQARENYNENERAIAEKAALEQKQVLVENEQAAKERKNALRKAVAAQQAAFGGQGIDTKDGSGQSVMLGLYKNAADDKTYRTRLDNLRLETINQGVLANRRKNLLNLQHNYENARDGFIEDFDEYTDFTATGKDQKERDKY